MHDVLLSIPAWILCQWWHRPRPWRWCWRRRWRDQALPPRSCKQNANIISILNRFVHLWFNLQRLIVAIVDNSPFLTLFALFLEVEILFKYRRKTIAFQQSNSLCDLLPILGYFLQINKYRNIITCKEIMNYIIEIIILYSYSFTNRPQWWWADFHIPVLEAHLRRVPAAVCRTWAKCWSVIERNMFSIYSGSKIKNLHVLITYPHFCFIIIHIGNMV